MTSSHHSSRITTAEPPSQPLLFEISWRVTAINSLTFFSGKEASQIEHSGQDGPFAFIYAVATLTWFWMHAGHTIAPCLLLQQQLSEVLEDPQRHSPCWQARRCKVKSNQAYLFSSEDWISNLFGEIIKESSKCNSSRHCQQSTFYKKILDGRAQGYIFFPHLEQYILAIVIRDAGQERLGSSHRMRLLPATIPTLTNSLQPFCWLVLWVFFFPSARRQLF